MTRQLILGLGTGQCGLELFAELMNRQVHARAWYQKPPLLPWNRSAGAPGIKERIQRLLQNSSERYICDVGHFLLPYAEDALTDVPELRVVCLQRPRDEVLAGFAQTLQRDGRTPVDHWSLIPQPGWEHDPIWTRTYPQFDVREIRDGLARYWETYNEQALALAQKFPDRLRIIDTEQLTHEAGVRDVLAFCRIPWSDQVILTGRRPALPSTVPVAAPRHPFPNPLDPRRCAVLVPFTGFIHQECEQALKELERRGYQVRRVAGYAAIDQGRNQMATDAILEGFEETLWIDSDVGFHPDDVDKLRRHGLPIVCGIYPQKGKRALACHIMPGTKTMTFGKGGGLAELLYAGTGFLLIRRQVYLTMQQQLTLPVCNERFGHPMIPFYYPLIRHVEDGYWYLAEDYAFCHRARECGFQVFADTTIRLWHVGNYRYGWEDAGREQPRTGSFTLNFNDQRPDPTRHGPARSDGLEQLAQHYPWPQQRPATPPPPIRDWFSPTTQAILQRTVPREARVIVELGSFLGRSTRFLAELAPDATVIAVDHWLGSDSMQNDPELAAVLPQLYELFLSESWLLRERIIPLRADTLQGLRKIAACGIEPDLIFLDADHRYDSVIADLTMSLELFPQAKIVGDDWNWPEVAKAVTDVTNRLGISYEVLGTGWRIVADSRPPLRPRQPLTGD